MSESERTIRILPTQQIAGYWDHEYSDYPDRVKVVMANGEKVTYGRIIEQPHPQCLKSIDLIRVMRDCTYGGYKAKHVKK